MKTKTSIIAIALIAFVTITAAGAYAADTTLYGNAAAKADTSLSIEDMLLYAAQDEYTARGEYAAIMTKFRITRPFDNIMRAEENHLTWLKNAFATYGLSFPKDESASHLFIPADLKQAFETGVKAEIDNIAMYDSFLASPLLKDPKYADLVALFTNLGRASENHLRAFQNQVARY